jgi:hypothetical protein
MQGFRHGFRLDLARGNRTSTAAATIAALRTRAPNREGGGQRSLSGCSALSKAFARASHTVVFTNKGRSPSSRVRLRSRLSVQSGSPTSFTASTPSVGEIDGVP